MTKERITLSTRCNGLKINISLNPGVYLFDSWSGSGKSYLCDFIHKYPDLFYNRCQVITYGHKDVISEEKIIELSPDILILDRYDLYAPKYVDLINQLAPTSAVLLDLKVPRYKFPFEYRIADIIYEDNHLDISNGNMPFECTNIF